MSIPRTLRSNLPAALCGFLLVVCALACRPFAEIGGNDDFAYVRSAKILADTGHVAYVGWSSAMLGWQLIFGALFIKVFGFSFTITRIAILLVAVVTAILLQKTAVRLGLSQTNAVFVTLTLVLSPLFIPLSVSFMSDIPGLLAIVLSLYLCARAIQSADSRHSTAWLFAAMVSSTVLGTARQTGWLGVLVMVPCACWILRRRVPVVPLVIGWILCVLSVAACLHWFSAQLYATVEEPPRLIPLASQVIDRTISTLRLVLDPPVFLVPIFFAFALQYLRMPLRRLVPAIVVTFLITAFFVLRLHGYWASVLLAPPATRVGDYVTPQGILELPAIGVRPLLLPLPFRLVLSVICYFSGFAFVSLFFSSLRQTARGVPPPERSYPGPHPFISWRQLGLLIGPFLLAYGALLSLRIAGGGIFDRYLVPILAVLAILAARFYQEFVRRDFPLLCFALLFLVTGFAVCSTHDMFAADRARLAAIRQLRNAGMPRTAIYGGFGYDGWTQIDNRGHIDVDDIRTPTGIEHLTYAQTKFQPCGYWAAQFLPAIHPRYVVSYDDSACDPQNVFPPVQYRLWLPPYTATFYIRSVSREDLDKPAN